MRGSAELRKGRGPRSLLSRGGQGADRSGNLTTSVAKTGAVFIFINQLREKVAVVYGLPEVTPGGRALKFYSSVRLDIRRVEAIEAVKEDSKVIGAPSGEGCQEEGLGALQTVRA